MDILFDISNLGMARHGGSFRTGIFRVVENLALGLHQTHECKTIFCATHCNHRDCRKALESYPELKAISSVNPTTCWQRFSISPNPPESNRRD